MRTLLVLLVCSLPAVAQNITSVSCWRSWVGTPNRTCFRSYSAQSGDMTCSCAATCGSNCNNISATYHVYWSMTLLVRECSTEVLSRHL